ncbi:MBL fold metallo-hydrolase [Herminiimonas sp. KBW02]|uniref:MBL fold metallo-hydrolase n=1 Tax=Herminiimonas sp. KBW02 TaxID=2153363 RepID=UPI000F5B4E41|nr:MBL fold metallo-hydrolase [Herminiimonas sp. KBW02]RQO32875.1 MBL fold metallo-hydrolase [Herminiimonas sp. KBW02]
MLAYHRMCGLLLLALALFGVRTAVAADEITLRPIKISPHVYYFEGTAGMASIANKGFMSNAGFVVTKDGVVVFDALATPVLGNAMLKAIKRITPLPVKRVIISHYHADHFYGLQAFKAQGAEVWAHENGRAALNSDLTQERLKQRRTDLAPWVNDKTQLIPADHWLNFKDGKVMSFEMGGMHFRIIDSSGAHSAEDIMLYVEEDKVLFAGDLFFTGRIPFVGEANSKVWLEALDRMLEMRPALVVPGHGKMSTQPMQDMQLTRDYLIFLRKQMGAAVAEMLPFDEAYTKVDWAGFAKYPAFEQANRLNAYGTYILMEKESLEKR